MNFRPHRLLSLLFSLSLLCLALWAIGSALNEYDPQDIMTRLADTPLKAIAAAVGFTVLSYLLLGVTDLFAVRHAKVTLPWRHVMTASFIAQAIAHSAGFGALTGSAIRYRLYASAGVSVGDVGRIVMFCTVTFFLGVAWILGIATLFEAEQIQRMTTLPLWIGPLVGVICLLLVLVYIVWCGPFQRSLNFGQWQFAAPSRPVAMGQIIISSIDLAVSGLTLYVLLPDLGSLGPLGFVGLYTIAIIFGVLSQSPGGIGVFEGTMLLLLPDLPADQVLGALLLYRLIYNLIPLVVATVLLGLYEAWLRLAIGPHVQSSLEKLIDSLSPLLFSVLILLAGGTLLISGATPIVDSRRDVLEYLPLLVLELSHIAGSVVGVWLIFMARDLYRRIDRAWLWSVRLLGLGILFSLLKGFDYEEALLLGLIMIFLYGTRSAFYRRYPPINRELYRGWLLVLAVILALTVWLTFLFMGDDGYSSHLLWQFDIEDDSARALRALLAVGVVVVWMAGRKLFIPSPKPPPPMTEADMQKAREIIAKATDSQACAVLIGDKHILFSASGNSFIMYGVSGSSWVALGDPVGPREEWSDLLWLFFDTCDLHGCRPVFYQVRSDSLPFYIDLGMICVKLGEEARLPLAQFSLAGKENANWRHACNRARKDGATFEVVPPEGVEAILPELCRVSQAWLSTKKTREKRFSLGGCDPDYLRRQSIAVVRQNDRIVAFASLWLAGADEASFDLMRHDSESGYGVMDYLFVELIEWCRAQGYQWLSLGMAPLSGLRGGTLSPLWNRLGRLVFRYGEEFYNFQGLRNYKDRFQPQWTPRYMAVARLWLLPRAVADVTVLISGGLRGLVRK